MKNQTNGEAWKIFLKGRIQQEKGENEEALKHFDQALKFEPDNEYFLNAKCIALASLNRHQEVPIAVYMRKGYSELAKTFIGKLDTPDFWIAGLTQLMQKAEALEKESILVDMCW